MSEKRKAFTGIRSIAQNAMILTSTQAIKIIARTVYVIIVARLLGPELYALLAYSQSWYLAFVPIAVFGLGPVVIRSIARQPDQGNSIVARGTMIQSVTTLLATGLCVGGAWIVSPNDQAPVLISVLGLALVGRSVNQWAQNLFIAFERTHHLLRLEAIFRILEVLVAATILFSGGGPLALITSHALIWLLQSLYTIHVIRKNRIISLRMSVSISDCLPMILVALPFFINTLTVVWRAQGPIILYGNLVTDTASFGRFALTLQLLLIAALLPQSLAAAAQPVVTRSAQRDDGKDLVYARAVLRASFLFGTAAAICGLAIGPWLLMTLFGENFSMSGELIGSMLLILIPITAGCAYPVVIIARGYFIPPMIAAVTGAILMTILLPILEPFLGPIGVIAAIATGYIAPWIVTSIFTVMKGWGNPFIESLRPATLSGATFILYFLLAPLSQVLALSMALLILVFGTPLFGIVTDRERRFLISCFGNRLS